MSDNLSLQSPDFDLIEKESGRATRDAAKLLWAALNFEMASRRQGVRLVQEKISPKVISDAPSAQQNNYDLEGSSILHLTGSAAQTFTGFRAPSTGESRILFIHNSGSATYTIANASGSSDSANQIRTQSGANVSITQDKSMVLLYLNSLWRELKLA